MRKKTLRSPRSARRARKRARQRIALVLCALALFLGSVLFLATRATFSIKEVVVSGASGGLRAAITELARAELAGAYFSLIPKGNAFAYPKREIAEKILQQFPRVETVRARLLSPSRLGLTVREREGVARWCTPGSRVVEGGEECLRIDASGVIFEGAPDGAGAEYRIREEKGEDASLPPLGTRVLEEDRLSALLSFLRSLEALSLSPSRLTLLSGGDVAAEIAGGGKIIAREGTDFPRQADNLRRLLSEKDLVPRSSGNLRVDYIDLRHGNKLYFKPR